jgi:hypothetical protein
MGLQSGEHLIGLKKLGNAQANGRNSKHWLQSNVDRLALTFGRPILGVHNKTQVLHALLLSFLPPPLLLAM